MATPSFRIAQVRSPSEIARAIRFHQRMSADDGHLLPRSPEELKQYTEDGCLFGAWPTGSDEIVGLGYMVLQEDAWELGGLSSSIVGIGIGSVVARFALAHTIVYSQPWNNGQTIIAHVHELNNSPRNLLTKILGFEFLERIDYTAKAPSSMRRNADGKVLGDTFLFKQETFPKLVRWFNEDYDGSTGRGGFVEFILYNGTFELLKQSLREML